MARFDVKALRKALGQTQELFGEHFPVGVRTVKRWEAGHADPSPMALKKLRELKRGLDPEQASTHASAQDQAKRGGLRKRTAPSTSPFEPREQTASYPMGGGL
jgi:transcriptional regulator with XRE-family HTH domain